MMWVMPLIDHYHAPGYPTKPGVLIDLGFPFDLDDLGFYPRLNTGLPLRGYRGAKGEVLLLRDGIPD